MNDYDSSPFLDPLRGGALASTSTTLSYDPLRSTQPPDLYSTLFNRYDPGMGNVAGSSQFGNYFQSNSGIDATGMPTTMEYQGGVGTGGPTMFGSPANPTGNLLNPLGTSSATSEPGLGFSLLSASTTNTATEPPPYIGCNPTIPGHITTSEEVFRANAGIPNPPPPGQSQPGNSNSEAYNTSNNGPFFWGAFRDAYTHAFSQGTSATAYTPPNQPPGGIVGVGNIQSKHFHSELSGVHGDVSGTLPLGPMSIQGKSEVSAFTADGGAKINKTGQFQVGGEASLATSTETVTGNFCGFYLGIQGTARAGVAAKFTVGKGGFKVDGPLAGLGVVWGYK